MKAVKVTSKGQITLPIETRTALGIDEGAYLEVLEDGIMERLGIRVAFALTRTSGNTASR